MSEFFCQAAGIRSGYFVIFASTRNSDANGGFVVVRARKVRARTGVGTG